MAGPAAWMSMRAWARTVLVIGLGIGMASAIARAGKTKFWERRKALAQEMREDQERLGLSGQANAKALYTKYPTPELTLCKPVVIAPGASAPVTLTGRFPEKTTFLVANDQVEIEPGSLTSNRYTTRATVATDAAAGYAPIYAIAPVSGAANSCPAVFIGPISSYELSSADGWTVRATPQAKVFEIGADDARLRYLVTFTKAGEAAPFRKMTGLLMLRFDQETGKEMSLPLQAVPSEGSPDEELAAVQRKIADPHYAQKMQKEREEFGCTSLSLTASGTRVTGRAACGRNIGTNGDLKLTGTAARVS